MTERSILIGIHAGLFLLQITAAGLAIAVDPNFAALSPIIGGAQGYFPNPFKS